MKNWMILPILLLLAGCYSTHEPYAQNGHLAREFGEANRIAWDRQIINRDQRHAFKTPTDVEGVHSEEIMSVRHSMYSVKPTKTEVIQLGIAE